MKDVWCMGHNTSLSGLHVVYDEEQKPQWKKKTFCRFSEAHMWLQQSVLDK